MKKYNEKSDSSADYQRGHGFGLQSHGSTTPPEESTHTTRLNVVNTIKNIVNKKSLATQTNPDETARITLLNKQPLAQRLKKFWWVGVILVAFIFFKSGGEDKKVHTPVPTENSTENNAAPESNKVVTNKLVVDYRALGKGLVFNCRQKTWACVNRNNYVNCKKLSKTDKSCLTQGVFDSDDDCLKAKKGWGNHNNPNLCD